MDSQTDNTITTPDAQKGFTRIENPYIKYTIAACIVLLILWLLYTEIAADPEFYLVKVFSGGRIKRAS